MPKRPAPTPDPAPRRRDRAATEEALLDAAERVVARDGFAALNVRAIAAEAGVDRKLVYRYFGDADGVLARLGAREERWGGKRTAAPPAATYADAMVALLRDYARDLGRDDTLQRMLAWELTESSEALTGLDRARSVAMRARMDVMRGQLRPPPDTDAPAVIVVALAALHYLTLRQRTLGSFAGVTLDAKGMKRAMAVIERMMARDLGNP